MSRVSPDPRAPGDEVIVEQRERVMVITLNRPHARNAVTKAVSVAVAEALDELDDRADLRAAVITGAGDHFCSGMDLKDYARGNRPSLPGRGFAGFVESPPTKPVVAAVEGYALAGGLEIVLACDLVVASTAAVFGLPEVRRGLVAAGGGLLRLPGKLPYTVALELALTGDRLAAERAHALGLVNRLVSPGDSLAAALDLADSISDNAPLAVRITKQVMESARDWPTHEAFARQRSLTEPVFSSADAAEGARAFVEKRNPVWRGV